MAGSLYAREAATTTASRPSPMVSRLVTSRLEEGGVTATAGRQGGVLSAAKSDGRESEVSTSSKRDRDSPPCVAKGDTPMLILIATPRLVLLFVEQPSATVNPARGASVGSVVAPTPFCTVRRRTLPRVVVACNTVVVTPLLWRTGNPEA